MADGKLNHCVSLVNKADILTLIIASLKDELETCLAAAKAASSAATDPDSKAENKYDTRSLEASYLARGQALRVAELEEALHAFNSMTVRRFDTDDGAALSALVSVKADGAESHYFLAPSAGGTEVQYEGHEIMVITPGSPLGQKLMGRKPGDQVSLPMGHALVTGVR